MSLVGCQSLYYPVLEKYHLVTTRDESFYHNVLRMNTLSFYEINTENKYKRINWVMIAEAETPPPLNSISGKNRVDPHFTTHISILENTKLSQCDNL